MTDSFADGALVFGNFGDWDSEHGSCCEFMDVPAVSGAFFFALSKGILEELFHLNVIDEVSNYDGFCLFVVSLENKVVLWRDEDFASEFWNVLEVAWTEWEYD